MMLNTGKGRKLLALIFQAHVHFRVGAALADGQEVHVAWQDGLCALIWLITWVAMLTNRGLCFFEYNHI